MDDTDHEPAVDHDVPSAAAQRQLVGDPEVPAFGRAPALGPGWLRALAMLLAVFGLQALALLAFALLVPLLPGRERIEPAALLASPSVWFAVNVPAVLLLLAGWKWVDRGTLADLGHRGPPTRILRHVLLGTLGGIALMSLIVAAGVVAGGWRVTFEPPDGPIGWIGWTPVLLLAAYFEELFLRGYLLQNLGRRWPLVGLVASSVLFGLLHLGNPNTSDGGLGATVILSVNIVLAGLLLGTLFLRTGDLWLPFGVHFGWNWAQGILFGLPVSGVSIPSIGHGELLETGLLTGTAFGPESSLIVSVLTGLLVAEGAWHVVRRRCPVPVARATAAGSVTPSA